MALNGALTGDKPELHHSIPTLLLSAISIRTSLVVLIRDKKVSPPLSGQNRSSMTVIPILQRTKIIPFHLK